MQYSYEESPAVFPWNGKEIREGIIRRTHDLVGFIMFSATYVAIAGGGLAFTSCFIQSVPWSISILMVMTLVAFSVYNLNRKTDEEEDAINHQERFTFTKRFEKPLFYAAVTAYGIALAVGALYGWRTFGIILIPIISGILYSEPLLPASWSYRRLKEIPVVKNLVVAIAWSLPLALLPVLMTPGASFTISTIVAGCIFFSYFIFASVLPDIRDREGDAATGVRTIPVVIGVDRTIALLTCVNLLLGGIVIAIGIYSLTLPVTLVLVAAVTYSQLCIWLMQGPVQIDLICDYLADGQFIFFGVSIGVVMAASGFL
jgi:4-hydroxybenzoate polyprenyltransferase